MGIKQIERKVHVEYTPELKTLWNKLSQDQKTELENLGKPKGYSGQNVLYFLLLRLSIQRFSSDSSENLAWETST